MVWLFFTIERAIYAFIANDIKRILYIMSFINVCNHVAAHRSHIGRSVRVPRLVPMFWVR